MSHHEIARMSAYGRCETVAVVWKQIPAKEAEARTRIILEIVAGELRRKREEEQDCHRATLPNAPGP